ncbi:transposase [Litchfieldella qijiaojingensis]|uniref:Transposase n=1 Tax=Litchfieldella qijiaojingensis TaxID=980347 RepID=A0ABQ2ZCS1_9GAMM|nr:IS21-like element helper ATPase IstB [Halomonas qijiaojingensis]GGY12641.1 transposase [Halomonas qijiaojingensis]
MPDTQTLPLLLRQLRLPTVAACWPQLETRAQAEGWSLPQTLAALCEHELAERERRRLARHLKEARLPVGKTLDSFEFGAIGADHRRQLTALAGNSQWVDQAHNLLLFGPSGVGKSHVAAGLGHSLVDQGYRVRYATASSLVQELQAAKQALRLSDALTKLDKYSVLIIDDIGYVKRSEAETSVLFELIAHRYESGSLIITANQPFSAWDSIFPDSMMAVAAIDRLVHHATLLELSGESYRKRAYQRQRRGEQTASSE